jgi:predicted kinase
MLIFKVGVRGSAPNGFAEALPKDYEWPEDMVRITKAGLTACIRDSQREDGHHRGPRSGAIGEELSAQAVPLLRSGSDVLVDIYFNTAQSRKRPIATARAGGALAVALYIDTPVNDIENRLRPLSAARRRRASRQQRADLASLNNLEPPQPEEGLDFIIKLNGSADAAGLVAQTGRFFEETGLAETG